MKRKRVYLVLSLILFYSIVLFTLGFSQPTITRLFNWSLDTVQVKKVRADSIYVTGSEKIANNLTLDSIHANHSVFIDTSLIIGKTFPASRGDLQMFGRLDCKGQANFTDGIIAGDSFYNAGMQYYGMITAYNTIAVATEDTGTECYYVWANNFQDWHLTYGIGGTIDSGGLAFWHERFGPGYVFWFDRYGNARFNKRLQVDDSAYLFKARFHDFVIIDSQLTVDSLHSNNGVCLDSQLTVDSIYSRTAVFMGGITSSVRNEMSTWLSQNQAGGETDLTNNAYYAGGWKYRLADYASKIEQVYGNITFYSALKGASPGDAITFKTCMVIDSLGDVTIDSTLNVDSVYVSTNAEILGKLGIGNNNPSQKVDVTGNIYVSDTVSALVYVDRTPFYNGNAIIDLCNIKSKDGQIDHSTLPLFAKTTFKENRIVGKDTVINGQDTIIRDIYESFNVPSRDLGAMVSILTKAVKELNARIDSLREVVDTKLMVIDKENDTICVSSGGKTWKWLPIANQ